MERTTKEKNEMRRGLDQTGSWVIAVVVSAIFFGVVIFGITKYAKTYGDGGGESHHVADPTSYSEGHPGETPHEPEHPEEKHVPYHEEENVEHAEEPHGSIIEPSKPLPLAETQSPKSKKKI